MAFDFVIETPQRRGINRNNNKIIQKRATQAGARTRLGNKNDSSCKNGPNRVTTTLPIRPVPPELQPAHELLANAQLSTPYNSPFLARFGSQGQMLYLPNPTTVPEDTCFRLPDPSQSVLQRHLLVALPKNPIWRDTNRLFKIMMLTQRQFLGHLPSLYGQLAFLDEAMECLIAKLHETVPLIKRSSNRSPTRELSPNVLYGKALTSLRAAIDHELTQNLSYIWFSIMLLTLFELLSMDDEPGWVWHAAGSARVLYRVGPENIKSEFHMSLLSLQCRVMVIETISTNKPCYLADPQWQEAIRRTILDTDDFSDRSRVSTELWLIGARIPNLFQAVTDVVNQLAQTSCYPTIQAIDRIVSDLNAWKDDWKEVLDDTCRNALRGNVIRHQSLMILLAYYTLTMIANRLRVALDPSEGGKSEREALIACAGILYLRRDLMSCRWTPQENGSIYTKVATATRQTTLRWKEQIENAKPGEPVEAEVFTEWCSLIGRSISASTHLDFATLARLSPSSDASNPTS